MDIYSFRNLKGEFYNYIYFEPYELIWKNLIKITEVMLKKVMFFFI